MSKSVLKLRNFVIAGTALAFTGMAALPTQAQAHHWGAMKSYGHTSPAPHYKPRAYHAPMMPQHSYHHPYGKAYGHKACKMHAWHHHHGKVKAKQSKTDPSGSSSNGASDANAGSAADIVDTASAAKNFTTLLQAAEAAGLADTLRGPGPFTVFAPSDEAFAKLSEGTLEGLLANKDKLVAVIGHHVVPERLTAADLLQRREYKTVQGTTLTIAELDVAVADIEASNGIIHAVDTVLVPSL